MVRSKPGGGPPSVRASEALLRIASVSSKLGGGASEALAVRGARGGVSPRRRGPCRRPHCSADAAEDVTAPMLAAIAGEAPLSKKCPILGEAGNVQPTIKPVGGSNEQMVRNSMRFFPPLRG